MRHSSGISFKKKYGQHFLRNQTIADHIVDAVVLNNDSSVFEIGGGDGFLTKTILSKPLRQLWVFEIDHQWADYLKKTIHDKRLTVFEKNFLDFDFSAFEPFKPWTLLSNLPYQITFPILHLLVKHRDLLQEGVIMVQEEVAEKIMKTSGRGYGFISLYLQYYFEWRKMDKIPPSAFEPPPQVFSRLLYLKPKKELKPIPDEELFWQFIKACFRQPRRTLKNNLMQTHYHVDMLDADILLKRAQQLNFNDLLNIWLQLRGA